MRDLRINLRTDFRPGDLGSVVRLHGIVYARERGFDATFEAYVAAPLAEFVCQPAAGQRLWLAELDEHLAGCIAVVAISETTAQLRWFLVDPEVRGQGLGKRLLAEALSFARESGYAELILWTEQGQASAKHLYQSVGFVKIEEKAGALWGTDVVEEKYLLSLT